jgi:hypothetical protein
VWPLEQGYLWCSGEEMEMVKASVEHLKVDMDKIACIQCAKP